MTRPRGTLPTVIGQITASSVPKKVARSHCANDLDRRGMTAQQHMPELVAHDQMNGMVQGLPTSVPTAAAR